MDTPDRGPIFTGDASVMSICASWFGIVPLVAVAAAKHMDPVSVIARCTFPIENIMMAMLWEVSS